MRKRREPNTRFRPDFAQISRFLFRPNGTRNARQGEDRRFIEVKGRAYRGPISLSANEYSAAKRLGRNYWLYVVFNCSSTPEVLAINDPARLNWKPLSKIEQYQVAASDIVRAKP